MLLHGRYTPTPSWGPIINRLAERFHVHAIDTMGEPGLSVNDRHSLQSRNDYIDWLDELFAELELRRAHVAGHSFGGWLAARYALQHPERTASLTLLEPAQVFAPFSPRWLLACVRPFLAPTVANVENLMRWLGNRRPGHEDLVTLAMLGMTGFRLRAPEATLVSSRALRSLRVPARQLIADGPVVHRPICAARRAAKLTPAVASHLIQDSSHFLFHDQPSDVLDIIDAVDQ